MCGWYTVQKSTMDASGAETHRLSALLDPKLNASRPIKSKCRGQSEDHQVAMVSSRLALIHIPREGGTSIEDCSADEEALDQWGLRSSQLNEDVHTCNNWHLPPNLMAVSNYYKGKTLFAR